VINLRRITPAIILVGSLVMSHSIAQGATIKPPPVGRFRVCSVDPHACDSTVECSPTTQCPAPRDCKNQASRLCTAIPEVNILGIRTRLQCMDISPAIARCTEEDAQAQAVCRSKQASEKLDCERQKQESHASCTQTSQDKQRACEASGKAEVLGSSELEHRINVTLNTVKQATSSKIPASAVTQLAKAYPTALLDTIRVARFRDFDVWYAFTLSRNTYVDVKLTQYLPYAQAGGIAVVGSYLLIDKNLSQIAIGELVRGIELERRYQVWGVAGVAQIYSYARADLDSDLLAAEQRACASLKCESALDIEE
jgi:hypothetical protein